MADARKESPETEENFAPLIQGQLISEQELTKRLPKEAITPWSLSDFEEVEQEKEEAKQRDIMQEVEKQIQPELQKRSEVLKKEVYDSAYQEGYEAGFKVGHQEGEATGKSQAYSETREFLFPKIEAANHLLQSLQAPQKQMQQKLFDEIIQFSTFIAEQMLGEQLIENPDWLYKVVRQSIQALPESEETIEVFLNPEDMAFLEEVQPEWMSQWRLTADEKIQPGSCLVKQNDSSVHNCWQERFLGLKEQLANNARILKDKEPSESQPDDSLDTVPWESESEMPPGDAVVDSFDKSTESSAVDTESSATESIQGEGEGVGQSDKPAENAQ